MRMSRRKPSQNVEHRLTKLEENVEELRSKLDEVISNVTNHIPTSIKAVKNDLDVLLDRKKTGDAIRSFCTNLAKVAFSLASFTWIVLQILRFFGKVSF